MYMNIGELKFYKYDVIVLLEIVFMEGCYYMVCFYLDGVGYVLIDVYDYVVMFIGVCVVKEYFYDYYVDWIEVILLIGIDEMIGMLVINLEIMWVLF